MAAPFTLIRLIDFETTGAPTEEERHAVCEVGFCDVVQSGGSWTVGDVTSMLVNPRRPVDIEARAVHHITDVELEAAPDVTVGFRALMEGMDPSCMAFAAHNADFERQFFGGGDIAWICTLKAAYRIFPDAPRHSNQVLRYFLGIDLDEALAMPPHRAGPDAYVTAHLLVRILETGIDPAELVRWSNGPALLPKVNFGKHKGCRWEDVPTDYLEWIAFKSDMDRDVKANAKHWLKQRGVRA
ncbi:exonuclease domain-containing protein [Aquamicrobium terrae]